jgi:hypothetical protein
MDHDQHPQEQPIQDTKGLDFLLDKYIKIHAEYHIALDKANAVCREMCQLGIFILKAQATEIRQLKAKTEHKTLN